MTVNKTSRRHFVQLAGGAALALRHGLLPAQTREHTGRAAATLSDSSIALEWDAHLHARVVRITGKHRTPMTPWGASDYLLRADGRHVTRFTLARHSPPEAIEDLHGRGRRIVVSGAPTKASKRPSQRHCTNGIPASRSCVCRIATAPAPQSRCMAGLAVISRYSNPPPPRPDSGAYSGASYEDRRDWVQPVSHGFEQDNFLGMEASDYGGGTPIVDVWHRAGGLAVGHVETSPKLVSLPVQEQQGRARIAVCSRRKLEIGAGETLQALDTFVAVHERDHFATLNTYRQLMAERGLRPAVPGPASYEPIWCAWGYERDCTTALIEGTLPKAKELGLTWAVIDDGWQAAIGDWRPHPAKYPNGEADLRRLASSIRAADMKPRLWYSPLSVAPGADLLHDHADMLLLDKEGAVQKISWWNSFYLCPAYEKTVRYTAGLVRQFLGEWGFAGLKIDGQHLNGVPPCFKSAHHHARPEDRWRGCRTSLARCSTRRCRSSLMP